MFGLQRPLQKRKNYDTYIDLLGGQNPLKKSRDINSQLTIPENNETPAGSLFSYLLWPQDGKVSGTVQTAFAELHCLRCTAAPRIS